MRLVVQKGAEKSADEMRRCPGSNINAMYATYPGSFQMAHGAQMAALDALVPVVAPYTAQILM